MRTGKGTLQQQARRIAELKELRGKKLVLFGAAVAATEVKRELDKRGVTVHAVIDNDPDKHGGHFQGLVVQRPQDVLVPHSDEYVVVIVAFAPAIEMLHQVQSLGYREGVQAFVITLAPLNESRWSFVRFALRMLRGLRAYRQLVGDPRRTLIVMPYPGTGDMYLVELFMRAFLAQRGIREDYVLAVGSKRCAQVAEMMGESRIKITEERTLHDVIAFSRFARLSPQAVLVLNEGLPPAPTEWLRGFKGLNFAQMFHELVFEFSDDVTPKFPPRSATNPAVLELFTRYGLTPGRTVVLSPYSNTLLDNPDRAFWARVTAGCVERGLTVCTNVGPKEKPIDGTKVVRFPLALAADFVETAGYFVGVRSGFCDIIGVTDCRKVVLYDKNTRFYKGSCLEYFSLYAMGLARNVLELEFEHSGRDGTADAVLEGLA